MALHQMPHERVSAEPQQLMRLGAYALFTHLLSQLWRRHKQVNEFAVQERCLNGLQQDGHAVALRLRRCVHSEKSRQHFTHVLL
jgi:hypothetical protein